MARPPLNGLSEAERARTFERFQLLRPFLEEGVPLARVARDRGVALRTARRWAAQYRREGLAGLARKERSDRGKRRLSDTLRQAIEGLALKKPPLSAAAIHRQAVTLAERLGEPAPTYRIVHAVISDLDPAYGAGHLAERWAWAARKAVVDHRPRRLQPGHCRICVVVLGPVGDPDGPGAAPGDLAERPTGL